MNSGRLSKDTTNIMEWDFSFMKKLAFTLPLLLSLSACNLLQVKVSPDPFYSVALQRNANNPAALYAQGMRFVNLGRYAEALPYFERLNRIEPNNAAHWFTLGRIDYEVHDFKKSVAAFEKAQSLKPSEGALLGLAAATLMSGNAARAQALADQSEKQYGESAALLQVRGDIAYMGGDATTALGFYQKSLEKNPGQEELQKRIKDLEAYLTSAR